MDDARLRDLVRDLERWKRDLEREQAGWRERIEKDRASWREGIARELGQIQETLRVRSAHRAPGQRSSITGHVCDRALYVVHPERKRAHFLPGRYGPYRVKGTFPGVNPQHTGTRASLDLF
jgi:hypothetical protein